MFNITIFIDIYLVKEDVNQCFMCQYMENVKIKENRTK